MVEINWLRETIDTIASLSGKYGRWLNIKQKKACFLIWAVCCSYWAVRDFYIGTYSQGIFAIFSVGLNIYGYFEWKRKEAEKSKAPTI